MLEAIYPRGGWRRTFDYVKHRIRRLPDTPEKIARGIWAGVFVSFTPFFGLHFLFAALVAKIMRGNILASLTGTFFANPLTYLPIAAISLQTGHWMLGVRPREDLEAGLGAQFARAWGDLWHNLKALFGPERMHWEGLAGFYDEVFLPYLVGGILPGIVVASGCYYLTLPLVAAHQKRRKKLLGAKLAKLTPPKAPDAP